MSEMLKATWLFNTSNGALVLSGSNGFYGVVQNSIPLYITGPLTSSLTAGSPMLSSLKEFWQLIIYVSAVSGTSPSMTITIGGYTTPPITSAPYTLIIEATKGHRVKVNLNNQQTIELPESMLSFESAISGLSVSFNISGTSPSFTVDHVLYFR